MSGQSLRFMGALGVLSGVTQGTCWGEEKQGDGGPVGGEAMKVEPEL